MTKLSKEACDKVRLWSAYDRRAQLYNAAHELSARVQDYAIPKITIYIDGSPVAISESDANEIAALFMGNGPSACWQSFGSQLAADIELTRKARKQDGAFMISEHAGRSEQSYTIYVETAESHLYIYWRISKYYVERSVQNYADGIQFAAVLTWTFAPAKGDDNG